jgi:LPXTG-motif cell wall-anchored protein
MTDELDPCLTYTPGSLKVYGYAGSDTDPAPEDSAWSLFAASTLTGTLTGVNRFFTVTEPPVLTAATSALNKLTVVAEKQKHNVTVGLPKGGSKSVTITDFNKLREYKFIKYTFECRVNERLVSDRDGHKSYSFENDADINFKNKFDHMADEKLGTPRTPRVRTSNKVRAHSAAILIDKIDAQDNSVLEGAWFKIASSQANAKAGNFLKAIRLDANGNYSATGVPTIIDVGHPRYNDTGANAPVDIELEAKKPMLADKPLYDDALWAYIYGDGSNPKSVLRFEGLKEFGTANGRFGAGGSVAADLEDQPDSRLLDSRPPDGTYKSGDLPSANSNAYLTYWLVETKTPPPQTAGGRSYNLLLQPVKVEFNKEVSKYTNWYTVGSNAAQAIRVRNSNRFTLPKTGGLGTILFSAGGVALVGVGVFLFILSARKRKQKAK